METLFSKVTNADIKTDPFPHLIVKNALPKELADNLLAAYPSLEKLGSGRQHLIQNGVVPNNQKLRYYADEVMADQSVSELWHEFIKLHTGEVWQKQFMTLFEDVIKQHYPQVWEKYEKGEYNLGIRHKDEKEGKMVLDAELCADTPVTKASSVKLAHLDHQEKIGVGLLYLRSPDNDSVGGSFQIYRIRDNNYKLDAQRILLPKYEQNLELVSEVPYEHNTFVFFFNTPKSFHGVTVRQPTNFPRYSFNVVFEVGEPLFNLQSVTAKPPILTRIRVKSKMLLRKFS